MVYGSSANLCSDFISCLYANGEKFLKEKLTASETEVWRGNTRILNKLDSLQKIDTNVSEEELKRIICATYIEGYPPKIELHGFTFR